MLHRGTGLRENNRTHRDARELRGRTDVVVTANCASFQHHGAAQREPEIGTRRLLSLDRQHSRFGEHQGHYFGQGQRDVVEVGRPGPPGIDRNRFGDAFIGGFLADYLWKPCDSPTGLSEKGGVANEELVVSVRLSALGDVEVITSSWLARSLSLPFTMPFTGTFW